MILRKPSQHNFVLYSTFVCGVGSHTYALGNHVKTHFGNFHNISPQTGHIAFPYQGILASVKGAVSHQSSMSGFAQKALAQQVFWPDITQET
ncbi:hypothetical protein E3N88_09698 [Mikania micrantha]|uniref:Uncharacterized protein n=1 Tax=Mikania micrantha TaxID=192012 RepID=A0A5N6PKG8_9ASTR|nr:hypothetical protein E3N88_09698 [Mikania micrantha]